MMAFVSSRNSLARWLVGMVVGLLLAAGFAVQSYAAEKVADPVGLSTKIQAQGSVRVIVTFNIPAYGELHATSLRYSGVAPGTEAPAAADAADKALAAGIASGVNSALGDLGMQDGLLKTFKTIPSAVLTVDTAGLHALENSAAVAYIEEDVPTPLPEAVEEDNGAGADRPALSTSTTVIGADQAWAAGYDGTGWYVAILDTGILNSHNFFAGKTIVEACYSSKYADNPGARLCPNGSSSQTGTGAAALFASTNSGYDHGVHVAGIAAGHLSDNSLNGVAKGANIIAVNVFSDGFTYYPNTVLSYTSDQILGLEHVYSLRNTYAIAAVNMSLGGGRYYSNCDSSQSARKAAIDNLRGVGIATVISSGNEYYCDSIGAPGCISTAPAIGATNNSDVRADFSNWQTDLVPLFAPGVSIYSSTGGGDNSFGYKSGTSMAAPHVCGAWAILKQKASTASVDTVFGALTSTGAAVDFDGDCSDPSGINRRIAVMDALNALPSASGSHPLLWHNQSSGKVAYWLLNDSCKLRDAIQDSGWGFVSDSTTLSSFWRLAGVTEISGENVLIWQNQSSGKVVYWKLNSANKLKDATQDSGWGFVSDSITLSSFWRLGGILDISGDNSLIWQNQTTGKVVYWKLTSACKLQDATQNSGWGFVSDSITLSDAWRLGGIIDE